MKDETTLVNKDAAVMPEAFIPLQAAYLAAANEQKEALEARDKYLAGLPHLAALEKRWVEAYRATDTAKAALLKWVEDNP